LSIKAANRELLPDFREQLFASLMANAQGGANAYYLASMLTSWAADSGALPAYMGLTPESFSAMGAHFFPGVELPERSGLSDAWLAQMPEKGELEALFNDYAIDDTPQRAWIAAILIAGSAGHHHLWEDIGLFNRADLTAMIAENFPRMAAKNDRDMKWKKFIYKQLCEREGIIACPAPTCDACNDFSICFASEEEPSAK
jgi:nitrogen fixation protein NifQ